jgi:AraC family transcriptional regulator
MKTDPIDIQELQEKAVAFVAFKGDFAGNTAIFAELFGKLCAWAGPKGLLNTTAGFLSSYQDDPKVTPPEEMRVDVCLTIPSDTVVEGEVQKKVLPGGDYAVMHSELSDPQEYGPAWNSIVEWSKTNGYEVDMSRPSYEIYLNNPQDHPQKHHILDICLSVEKS